jgi:DNA-binding transcriptional LysR family regulator
MLNLEHISSFLAVLRTRNFRAAAHERALSQATVSQHIQKLEAALNTRLITRSHSGCTPTPAGTALLPHAESLLRINTRALNVMHNPGIAIGASSNGTGTGTLLVQHLGEEIRGLQAVVQLGSTEAVKRWVKAGLGVSIVLSSTVVEECRAGTLRAIPLEGDPICKALYVIWRATLRHDSLPLRLAKWLLDNVAQKSA